MHIDAVNTFIYIHDHQAAAHYLGECSVPPPQSSCGSCAEGSNHLVKQTGQAISVKVQHERQRVAVLLGNQSHETVVVKLHSSSGRNHDQHAIGRT